MDESIYLLMHEPNPFWVGRRVKISPSAEYAADFPGEYIVVANTWEYQRPGGLINIAIASEDDIRHGLGATDGWRPDDLLPVSGFQSGE